MICTSWGLFLLEKAPLLLGVALFATSCATPEGHLTYALFDAPNGEQKIIHIRKAIQISALLGVDFDPIDSLKFPENRHSLERMDPFSCENARALKNMSGHFIEICACDTGPGVNKPHLAKYASEYDRLTREACPEHELITNVTVSLGQANGGWGNVIDCGKILAICGSYVEILEK